MTKLKFKIDSFKFSFYKKIFIISLIIFFFFMYMKISKDLSPRYYQENKKRLQRKAREIYQNYPKKEKVKKEQDGCERYKNLLEDEKPKLC